MNRIAQVLGEYAADAVLFLVAFLLSTGLTCGGVPIEQVTCGGAHAEVSSASP